MRIHFFLYHHPTTDTNHLVSVISMFRINDPLPNTMSNVSSKCDDRYLSRSQQVSYFEGHAANHIISMTIESILFKCCVHGCMNDWTLYVELEGLTGQLCDGSIPK